MLTFNFPVNVGMVRGCFTMEQSLIVFIKVVEKENFSRAAKELHMTQPAVSQYIRTLEENIGVRLLERTNKYVRLNKAGEIVYHHAKEITGLHAKMQNLVDDLVNKASGPISIGASYTFGEYVLPRIIAKMRQLFSDIYPTVTIGNTAEIAELVKQHQLDIGIVEGHFKDEDQLDIKEIAKDEMVIVASYDNKLTRKGEISVGDLVGETWIVREIGSGTMEAAETIFQDIEFTPNQVIHFSSTQSIKEAVEAGLGISLLSRWAIQKELELGYLQILPVAGLPFRRQFSTVTTSPFQTKALKIFIELLINQKELTDF